MELLIKNTKKEPHINMGRDWQLLAPSSEGVHGDGVEHPPPCPSSAHLSFRRQHSCIPHLDAQQPSASHAHSSLQEPREPWSAALRCSPGLSGAMWVHAGSGAAGFEAWSSSPLASVCSVPSFLQGEHSLHSAPSHQATDKRSHLHLRHRQECNLCRLYSHFEM